MEKERKPFTLTNANIATVGIPEINATWEGKKLTHHDALGDVEYVYEDDQHRVLLRIVFKGEDAMYFCHHGNNVLVEARGDFFIATCSLCGSNMVQHHSMRNPLIPERRFIKGEPPEVS